MRVEVAYPGRIEVFDTDRFTEAQPFTGKSMLADFTLDYEDAEKDGIWLTAHCYAANESLPRTDGEEVPEARREKGWRFQLATPKETAAIESVAMDGSAVLARLYGELVDVARIDRACSLLHRVWRIACRPHRAAERISGKRRRERWRRARCSWPKLSESRQMCSNGQSRLRRPKKCPCERHGGRLDGRIRR